MDSYTFFDVKHFSIELKILQTKSVTSVILNRITSLREGSYYWRSRSEDLIPLSSNREEYMPWLALQLQHGLSVSE